jgi:hypothetical protein
VLYLNINICRHAHNSWAMYSAWTNSTHLTSPYPLSIFCSVIAISYILLHFPTFPFLTPLLSFETASLCFALVFTHCSLFCVYAEKEVKAHKHSNGAPIPSVWTIKWTAIFYAALSPSSGCGNLAGQYCLYDITQFDLLYYSARIHWAVSVPSYQLHNIHLS